ncbi:MAG TPA: prepilin-type N-terminal cleavage/methylation domain-containing protein [Verrucomicrobiae bacterium]|jgi:prepilin-type N-terminal cleavage/methylation domain-containing protein
MKPNGSNPSRFSGRRQSGMTLPEVMISSAIMVLAIAAMISANMMGFKENQLMTSKSGASDTSRYAVNTLLQDIRLAKGYQIGNIDSTNAFIQITNGLLQGTAIQLFPIIISSNQTIDITKYILYYFDLSDTNNNNGKLWRYTSTNQVSSILASNLINSMYFSSEDYSGTVQSSRTYKGVIHTTLQFCEFQFPLTKVGPTYLFNYYRIDCRATPHLPDGP